MSTQSNKPALPKPTRRELNSNPYSQQGLALARLLANPDREIVLPGPPKSEIKTIRAPRDVIPGIQGSSAGAGSGEFHTYRAGRRRENERLDIMDQQDALVRTPFLQTLHQLADFFDYCPIGQKAGGDCSPSH